MIGISIRTASRARASCVAVEPSSSGRSSALPPNATTARGRTNEKNGVGFIGREPPASGLALFADRGHLQAPRPAAGARELVSREEDDVLLVRLPELELLL